MIVSGRVLLSPHQQSGAPQITSSPADHSSYFGNHIHPISESGSGTNKHKLDLFQKHSLLIYSKKRLYSCHCSQMLVYVIYKVSFSWNASAPSLGTTSHLTARARRGKGVQALAESNQFFTRSRVNRNCVIEVLLRGWKKKSAGSSLPE